MTAPAGVLEAVLALLLREESALGRLIELAVEEQRALIASDFAVLDAVSAEMLAVSTAIEATETERLNLLRAGSGRRPGRSKNCPRLPMISVSRASPPCG